MIEFKSPSELAAFEIPEGFQIVGDFHLSRGCIAVLAGPPGCGKSRAATFLAVAGATGRDWFGLKVHRQFRTMIVQCENGPVRLKKEFADAGIETAFLDEWIRVTPPPPCGLAFLNVAFLAQLRQAILAFQPDVIVLDPWNRVTKDETAKDFLEAFELVMSALPPGDDRPALLILAHTRKPRQQEKASGRALMNLISGSFVLSSVPRTVFILQPASDDTTDDRVVFTVAKNNDGDLGPRSVWKRKNGIFDPIEEFDWDAFDNPGQKPKKRVTIDHLREVFDNGNVWLRAKDAAEKLQDVAGIGRTLAYDSLKHNGEFGSVLHRRDDGCLGIIVPRKTT